MSKDCIGLYERIAQGELPSRMAHANLEHGVFVILDIAPVSPGHLTIASLACSESMDKLSSPVLHDKIYTTAKYAGRVLSAAFPEAPYIGELTASNQIRHPHTHRVPGDEDATWARRFSKLPEWPRLKLSSNEMDDILGRVTTGSEVEELWAQCYEEVAARGEPDELTVQAIQNLGIAL